MRKDPPFDSEFFYATHLLEQAEREGARVFNKPAALRDHPEKLAILEFPELIPPTLVTRSADDIRHFHAEYRDIILKPLDGMGGVGIFRVGPDGLNLGSITETLNQRRRAVGDGAALPDRDHAGRQAHPRHRRRGRAAGAGADPAGQRDPRQPRGRRQGRRAAAQPRATARSPSSSAPILNRRGLLLIGLDVIGDWLTEINVTSPTGFQEIAQQTGFDVAKMFVDALEAALAE